MDVKALTTLGFDGVRPFDGNNTTLPDTVQSLLADPSTVPSPDAGLPFSLQHFAVRHTTAASSHNGGAR